MREKIPQCSAGGHKAGSAPEWVREALYILSDDWVADELASNPDFLYHITLQELQPRLFPHEKVLAEMIVARDRIRDVSS